MGHILLALPRLISGGLELHLQHLQFMQAVLHCDLYSLLLVGGTHFGLSFAFWPHLPCTDCGVYSASRP